MKVFVLLLTLMTLQSYPHPRNIRPHLCQCTLTRPKKKSENFEGKNSSKRKGEKEDHTLIIWEAMQSLDNDLKKEAKPTMIWNYLRKNINKYNTNGVIISISHDVMTYFESNGTEGHITKESFRKAIERLRENPPK